MRKAKRTSLAGFAYRSRQPGDVEIVDLQPMEKKMRKSLMTFSIAAAAIGFATGAVAAEAKYSLKMTTTTPEGTLTWNTFAVPVSEKIGIATDGEIAIKPYGSGALASLFEGHRAVLDGRADLAHHYPAFEINQNPASAFISDIPGGMGTEGKIMWVMAGGGRELWTGYRESQGLFGTICGAIGSEIFAHSHKKIQKLADLKGFKYRTAGANTWVMRKLGASPTLVPGPEVFTLLERKGFDGAEYLDPYGNTSLGLHKVAKYVILPGIHAPGAIYELLMKKELWEKFPAETQKKIVTVCDAVTIESYATMTANNVKAMQEIKSNGFNEVVQLDQEVIEAVRKTGREWAAEKSKEEEGKGNPWMTKLMESYYGFQDAWRDNSSFMVFDARFK